MEQGFQVLLQVFGGLALFLYGTDSLCRAVQQGAGRRLRSLLARCTANPAAGLLTGAAVTAVLQSSSAVTVMVIAFLAAGLLQLRQAVPVVFGANIGTTVTAQLLAFRVESWRYLLLFGGVLLCLACKGWRGRCVGEAVFGFGLLFEGVTVMRSAMEPLLQSHLLRLELARVQQSPLHGLLAGVCMTLTVQSSSATVALLQSMAAQPGADGVHSLLGLTAAIPILLGDNIGTTITAVLAAIGQGRDAKRVAAAHAIFNLSGAAVCCALLQPFAALVRLCSPAGVECAVIARQIANAHTLFNVLCALVWLPLTGQMVRLVCALLPDKKTTARTVVNRSGEWYTEADDTIIYKGWNAMKRKIGRLCMVLGAVLILCAAGLLGYNRWDAARAEKASQEVLGELEQTMQKTITEHQQENETAAPQPVLDPTQEMTTVEVEGRDYIGVLSIPAVERELPVMAQWSYAGLKIAPGRYSGTTYGDDLVICGHNYAMHFSPIKWLAIGSSVYFTDADGLRWSYEVESVETLRPTQIEEMTTDTETDNWDLTLFTCTSGGGSRYAVRCVRTGYPVRVTDAAE